MTEQKTKKSKGIAKKLKRNILAPCIKSPREKQNVPDKHDLDNIDNGSLYFDSSKYLKKRNSDLDTISSTLSRPTSKTEVTTDSEMTDYLRRKPQSKGKEKEEITEIIDIESSDSDDDIPLSQLTKLKQTPTLQQKVEANTIKNEETEIKETENVEIQNVPMPIPVDSVDANPVSIPAKMEPTKSEMGSLVDANVVKQSIPMPQPTDSIKEETEISNSANDTSYIIEEIVTEEIVNGKKIITTQTITRRANKQNQATPMNNVPNVSEQTSLKMPVAVGSEMEEVKIPAKMTPTKTETNATTEGIVEMPMNLPKPSSSNTISNNGIPNLIESELEGMPISEIVNENNIHPNAMSMPSVPKVPQFTTEVPQENITENIVSSPKLMAEESPLTTTELTLDQHQPSQPVVEPGFNINVPPPPQPVEAGFNFTNIPPPAPSVEAGFNIFVPNQSNGNIPPPPPQLQTQPSEPGFNFTVTNEDNKAIPLPIPGNHGNENILNNTQGIPNLLATDSANRKQAKQQGYLDIPQPLPPSAIEDNQVVEDDRSDVSYGSKKNVVSSPKVLTADEQIQFSEQLETNQKIEHEEALKNEKPIGTFTMPKTPSTYFKNNNLSDNEGDSNEAVNVPSPAALPTVFNTPAVTEVEKMNVNTDQEEESDDENLYNIKQKYEQKKKELEAKVEEVNDEKNEIKENIKEELKDTKEDIREELKDIKEDVKDELNEVKDDIKEEGTEAKENFVEEVEDIPNVQEVQETKEEIKDDIKEELETEVIQVENQDIPVTEDNIVVNGNIQSTDKNNYASSEGSFDNLMGSLKRKNGAKSIRSFFGFGKKDKKDKKDKKEKKSKRQSVKEETPSELPDNSVTATSSVKGKKGSLKSNNESHFSLKRLVSPFSNSKRRNGSIRSKSNKSAEKTELSEVSTIPEIPLNAEVVHVSEAENVENPVAVRAVNDNDVNKVVGHLQAQAGQPAKFVIPEEALDRAQLENQKTDRKVNDNDKSSINSSNSESDDSKSVSSSSSSSDEEVLGNLIQKNNANNTTNQTNNNREIDINRNYTNIDNDDFVSIMMVQRMLSSSSLDNPVTSPIQIPEKPTPVDNPFNVDLEFERRKSYSKPRAVVTAVNPRMSEDDNAPRSTILYKFEDRPEKPINNNIYRSDYASRSVGSIPVAAAAAEKANYSPKQRMSELNLDTSRDSINVANGETDNINRSILIDSNLKQMFDDIHNLSLDDITNRYTKEGMIQCDIGPSFMDEVMGSLSMK